MKTILKYFKTLQMRKRIFPILSYFILSIFCFIFGFFKLSLYGSIRNAYDPFTFIAAVLLLLTSLYHLIQLIGEMNLKNINAKIDDLDIIGNDNMKMIENMILTETKLIYVYKKENDIITYEDIEKIHVLQVKYDGYEQDYKGPYSIRFLLKNNLSFEVRLDNRDSVEKAVSFVKSKNPDLTLDGVSCTDPLIALSDLENYKLSHRW